MDDLDIKILNILDLDSRTSFKEIAKRLEVSDVTIKNRMKKMVENGVISRFTIDLDYEKIGYPLIVTMGLSIDPGRSDEILDHLKAVKEFYLIWRTSGAHGVNIRGAFKDNKHLNRVIDKELNIPGIREYHLSIMDKVVKNRICF